MTNQTRDSFTTDMNANVQASAWTVPALKTVGTIRDVRAVPANPGSDGQGNQGS
ncbi:hypothetical protein [Croceicoccus ponticola]|uniref:hypothetical protein n=1 Tax=Croceicoccus ponticola TaxID=2217664 RepID=UPI0013E398F5|nr:hypothetical protein [Croceicoccus ponticola]